MLHHIENHVENMRQKPEHKRRQYALALSLSFTLIVFGFWVAARRTPNEAVDQNAVSPVKALGASAIDAFDYVKTFFVSGNKAQYSNDGTSKDGLQVLPGKN